MILVTGAGGKTGRAVVRALSPVERVRAFVHREEQVPAAVALGAEEAVSGDMRDEAAVRSAMRGARAVYHICPNMSPDEIGMGETVIGAARASGVEHFVYHSVLHPQAEKMPHHWRKLRTEEMVFESGLPFTILQPAPYMQNLLAGWERIAADGLLRVPYSVQARFSFIDLEDLAEAARIVLTEPGHRNAVYELAGTAPMSHVEVADLFGRALNRQVRAEEGLDDWRARTEGLSAYAQETLAMMFAYYDRWGLAGNPNLLRWLLGRKPTPLAAFAARTVGERHGID